MSTLRKIIGKPKTYFLVFFIAPLLLSTALIQVQCPVCDGKGSIVSSTGMDGVKVISVEPRIISSVQDACSNYVITKARPTVSLMNIGEVPAQGWLKMHLVDVTTGQNLADQYLQVAADPQANAIQESLLVFAFYAADTPPENLGITAEVMAGDAPDLVCNGTGHVSLNTYLLARAYKEKLVLAVESQQNFGPDLSHGEPGSQEWLDWWELS